MNKFLETSKTNFDCLTTFSFFSSTFFCSSGLLKTILSSSFEQKLKKSFFSFCFFIHLCSAAFFLSFHLFFFFIFYFLFHSFPFFSTFVFCSFFLSLFFFFIIFFWFSSSIYCRSCRFLLSF